MSYPRVRPVGEGAVTVELGPNLDEDTIGRVRGLDRRLRERSLAGVLEAVPTCAALMVLYDRKRVSFAALSEILLRLARDIDGAGEAGRLVEIPAAYDGEDLGEVADACGLTREAVVELHSGPDYTVFMLGFSPGFAYLGFVDARLRVPRRKTPRVRVPAGAIAVAGPQTGIYPRSLPGGWNLLGRTSVQLFRPEAPNPSLLLPGDRVRFVPGDPPEPGPPPMDPDYTGDGAQVREAGILTTVQDGGRPGWRRLAVPRAGYADPASARAANLCVGNPVDAPVLEACGPGLGIVFAKTTFVAITGARSRAEVERHDLEGGRMPLPMNAAVLVRESNVLRIVAMEDGARVYVAIAGLDAPRVLGSASVDSGSGLLRALRAGDRLAIGPFDADRVRRDPLGVSERTAPVRVILGPQADHFSEPTIRTFLETAWRAGLDSNRVGARLDGPRLAHAGPSEIISDGMVPGCIQVPPDGRPIVMLSDCPTTGGYPKIGCVVAADLGVIAQAVPGRTPIRFVEVRVDDVPV